jgi:hypothetical protein
MLPQVVRWLRRKRITSRAQLTQQDMQAAHRYYRSRRSDLSGAVRALGRFYVGRGRIPEGQEPTPSPVEIELYHFVEYLRESRGLAEERLPGPRCRHCFVPSIVASRKRETGQIKFDIADRNPELCTVSVVNFRAPVPMLNQRI